MVERNILPVVESEGSSKPRQCAYDDEPCETGVCDGKTRDVEPRDAFGSNRGEEYG